MITIKIDVRRSLTGGYFGNGVLNLKDFSHLPSVDPISISIAADADTWDRFQRFIRKAAFTVLGGLAQGEGIELDIHLVTISSKGTLIGGPNLDKMMEYIRTTNNYKNHNWRNDSMEIDGMLFNVLPCKNRVLMYSYVKELDPGPEFYTWILNELVSDTCNKEAPSPEERSKAINHYLRKAN